jgi:hypothetical protein
MEIRTHRSCKKLSASQSRFLNQAWDAADDRLAIRMIGSQTLGNLLR